MAEEEWQRYLEEWPAYEQEDWEDRKRQALRSQQSEEGGSKVTARGAYSVCTCGQWTYNDKLARCGWICRCGRLVRPARADSEGPERASGAGSSAPWPREGQQAAAADRAHNRPKRQRGAGGEERPAAADEGAQEGQEAATGPAGRATRGGGKARQRAGRGARQGGHPR